MPACNRCGGPATLVEMTAAETPWCPGCVSDENRRRFEAGNFLGLCVMDRAMRDLLAPYPVFRSGGAKVLDMGSAARGLGQSARGTEINDG